MGSGTRGRGSRRRSRAGTGRRSLDRVAGREFARELALERRWEIIRRHALLNPGGSVRECVIDDDTKKVAYPSERAARNAHQDLHDAGAHDVVATPYPCSFRLGDRVADHWHLTTHPAAAR